MRYNFNKVQKIEFEIKQNKKGTVSTFMVPEKFLMEINAKWKDRKIDQILGFLLWKYRQFIAFGQIPVSKKLKMKYQDTGLNLIPVKFRPTDLNWAELGIIAYSLGVTRCWLFSYLLDLEFSLMGEFLELPEIWDGLTTSEEFIPKKIWLFTNRKEKFQRILHFKV